MNPFVRQAIPTGVPHNVSPPPTPSVVSPQQAGLIGGARLGWGDAVSLPGQFNRAFVTPVDGGANVPITLSGKVGYGVGRLAGDLMNHGTQKVTWNLSTLDMAETGAKELIERMGGNKTAKTLAGFGTALGVGIGSGNINPMNAGEFGRVAGYAATQPDSEDKTKTENPTLEVIDRAVLGRTGRLLPWEQFTQERPDVSYDDYAKYQEYMKDPGVLGLGLIKGTMDGIEGPEARFMGSRITPTGAAMGLGALGAVALGVGRLAALRR